jgi:hypothetical protein
MANCVEAISHDSISHPSKIRKRQYSGLHLDEVLSSWVLGSREWGVGSGQEN